MRNLLFFGLTLCLLSCTSNQGQEKEVSVSYPESDGIQVLSPDLFSDIEMVRLTGDGLPALGSFAEMVVTEDHYYISSGGKVFRFNSEGGYLNSIGSKGNGPNEYLAVSNILLDDSGNIAIYSGMGQGILLTYAPSGEFLNKKMYPYPSAALATQKGFNYHYFGDGSGRDYQLYVTDGELKTVQQFFPSAKVYPMLVSPVFTSYEQTLLLCPSYGNEVYQLKNGTPEVKYRFDFGQYTIPQEYYNRENAGAALDFLIPKTFAIKNMFFENKRHAVLQGTLVQLESGMERTFYGFLNKREGSWRWFCIKEKDFMNYTNLKFLDREYAYFAVDPELMRQAGLAERFPLLKDLPEAENMVILKCKF